MYEFTFYIVSQIHLSLFCHVKYFFYITILWVKILCYLFSEASKAYANELTKSHDEFLQSYLERGSYDKIYSFKHIINGVAVHTTPSQVFCHLQTITYLTPHDLHLFANYILLHQRNANQLSMLINSQLLYDILVFKILECYFMIRVVNMG